MDYSAEIKRRLTALLRNENSDRKYCFYNLGLGKKNFLFIMEKPHKPTESSKNKGKNKRFEEAEKKKSGLVKDDPKYLEKRSDIDLGELKLFIAPVDNPKNYFAKTFFKTVIDSSDWQDIMNKFCFTDASKCNNDNFYEEDKELLKLEIAACNPKIIFAFGKRAWKSLREKYTIKPIDEEEAKKIKDIMQISKVHGVLFTLKDKQTNVLVSYCIPSMFFIGQNSPNCAPRDSYFDYFKEGFKKFNELPEKRTEVI